MIPNWALVVEIFIIEMLWSQLAEVKVTVLFFLVVVAKWLVLVDDVGWGKLFFLGLLCGWMALCECKKIKEHSNGRTYVSIVFCQEELWSLESILCFYYSEHLF